jgi:hypothetical protein
MHERTLLLLHKVSDVHVYLLVQYTVLSTLVFFIRVILFNKLLYKYHIIKMI